MQDGAFNVDIAGLLEALTQQFPEPLLCVRELVQNAADARAEHIQVEVSYDPDRSLLRLGVRDDGCGMGPKEVEGYLTIGFSQKDPDRDRGRFGIGKLSPYALGIDRMTVETSDGRTGHRLSFSGQGTGHIHPRTTPGPRGTEVRIYKKMDRVQAERWAQRIFELVQEHCSSLPIVLTVNGAPVAESQGPGSRYTHRFGFEHGHGSLFISADPRFQLLSGSILLESSSPLFGDSVGYSIDSTQISPTLSRNSVRRDRAFEALVRTAKAQIPRLVDKAVQALHGRVTELRLRGFAVERELDPDDRAAVEWLRARLMEPEVEWEAPLWWAPVFETADGGLVSAEELKRGGPLPVSRVPRSREELLGYADRGVPVLLLYRDVEDLLARLGVETVEVDDLDLGSEVQRAHYSPGEAALVGAEALLRPERPRKARAWRTAWVAGVLGVSAAGLLLALGGGLGPESPVGSAPSALSPGAPSAGKTEPGGGLPLVGPGFKALLLVALVALVAFFARSVLRGPLPPLSADPARPRIRRRKRRLHQLGQALLHPKDFLVARWWNRGSHPRATVPPGYREFPVDLQPVEVGVRLNLDAIPLGFIDLRSAHGAEHEGRSLVVRSHRVLLNRNHPTIRHLVKLAERDWVRARILLESLLGTDPELAKNTDPRQVEWDLLNRARHWIARRRG